ncbi:MAG: haloacid dehalogenase-like hydrolase [Bacteroidales bacterium]|nr:haloacid dehalogenase-like hydrolase [Bacteroidales bacterium]
MKKQAVAIDLDGTLIMGNTFRDYLSFCGKKALACCRFDLCFVILWMVLLRRLRLVSHARMKRVLLLEMSVFFSQKGRLGAFVDEELQKLNPKVLAQIEAFRNQDFALALVTAAPVSYAQEIAARMCFDACLATPLPSSTTRNVARK